MKNMAYEIAVKPFTDNLENENDADLLTTRTN